MSRRNCLTFERTPGIYLNLGYQNAENLRQNRIFEKPKPLWGKALQHSA